MKNRVALRTLVSGIWYLVCLCLSLVLLVGRCGRTDVGAKLDLSIPAVPDGEASLYRIRVFGDSVGTLLAVLRHDMLALPGEEEPAPVFALSLVTRALAGSVPVTDSSVVYVGQRDLGPKSSFRFIRTGAALTTTAANYGPHSVAVSSFSAGRETQRLFANNPHTFDIDGLTLLGRALKFATRKQVKVSVVNPMGPPLGGVVLEAEFRWVGDEQLVVPAGSFDCRRVQLRIGKEEMELWYERTGTKRLVRYVIPGAGLTIDLMPLNPAASGQ